MTDIKIPYGLPCAGGPQNRPAPMKIPEFGAVPPQGDGEEGAVPPPPPAPEVPFLPLVTVGKDGVEEMPLESARMEGTITEDAAEHVRLVCDQPAVNGIYIKDDTEYEIDDADIHLKGDGANDFAGNGAGIQVTDCADVRIEDTTVETTGVIRPCTVADADSTVTFRNVTLIGNGGRLAPNEPRRPGPGMRQPPEGLGIGGNSRTHLSMGNSHTYFYDSRITADGWAALSTDACKGDLYLEANRCEIMVRNSGYAVYSDIGGATALNDCRIDTEIGAILAGECRASFRYCDVHARDCMVMFHSVMGTTSEVGKLSVQGGSADCEKECIRIKSQNAYLDLRSVNLHSKTGVLLHSIVNPDECATKVKEGEEVYGIKAVLSDMNLAGDILHEDTDRMMTVCLKHTCLTGGVQNAVLCLDAASAWTADRDSEVLLTAEKDAGRIDALEGVTIRAKSDYLPAGTTRLPSGGTLVVEE